MFLKGVRTFGPVHLPLWRPRLMMHLMTLTYVLLCFSTPFYTSRTLARLDRKSQTASEQAQDVSTPSVYRTRAHRILDHSSLLKSHTTQCPHGCPLCTTHHRRPDRRLSNPLLVSSTSINTTRPFVYRLSFLLACGTFRCRSNAERSLRGDLTLLL